MRSTRLASVTLFAASLAACTGTIDTGPVASGTGPLVPARVPLRPLTPAELDFALDDLLDDDTSAVLRLSPSRVRSGVETMGSDDMAWIGGRSDLLVDAMYTVAQRAVEHRETLSGCAAREGDTTCASTELRAIAAQAWRRAPTDEEMARIDTVVTSVTADVDRREGLVRGLQAVLLSPELLYLTSIGTDAGVLDQVELASRLSFFVWASLPDAALLAAAERGDLDDAAAIEREVRRMLRDPRAGRAMSRFVQGWLGALDLGAMTRSDPAWNGELARDMAGETDAFVLDWFRGDARGFGALFYGDHTFVTPRLAEIYGLTLPEGSAPDQPTRVSGTQAVHRYGLLTQSSFLASHALESASSPTFRGRWFLERALCQAIDGPPPNALRDAPQFTADMTTREWHEAILGTMGCDTCHRRMEPPGFALERFDAIGRARVQDRGEDVVTSTTLTNGTELDGAYESEEDFSEAVATSPTVRGCFARYWVQYALGRPAIDVDRRLVVHVARDLETDAQAALLRIVTSDGFRTTRSH